jgi:hypothetical protein
MVLLQVHHLLLLVLIESQLDDVGLSSLSYHQLILGILDLLGLLRSQISERLSTLSLVPLSVFHFLLFDLSHVFLIIFMLQTLECLSFALSLVDLFLSSLMLHLKHPDSVSQEFHIIFNPIKK